MRINGTAVGLLRRALRLEDMLRAVQDQAIVSTRLAEERAEEIESMAARLRKTDELRVEIEELASERAERIAELESDLAGARAAAGTLRERDAGRGQWINDRIAALESALRDVDVRRLELEERARESGERIANLETDLANALATAGVLRDQLRAKTLDAQERDAGRDPHPWMGRGWDGDRIAKIESALQRAETEAQKARADAAIYANAIGRIEAALGLSGSRPPHELVEHVERLKEDLQATRAANQRVLADAAADRLDADQRMRTHAAMRGLDGEGEG